MAQLFDTYEEEFEEVRSCLEQRIKNIPKLDGDKRETEVQEAESNLQEAEQILKSMSLSARNMPSNTSMSSKVKGFEADLQRLRTNLRKAILEFQATSNRNELFSGLKDSHLSSSMEQRERLLSATERLERSHRDLDDSIRTAEETTHIGIEVMQHLDAQKSQMMGMREKLAQVNSSLKRAKKLMNSMARRVMTNKLIMAIVTLVLLGGIILVIWLKWGGSSSSTPEPN